MRTRQTAPWMILLFSIVLTMWVTSVHAFASDAVTVSESAPANNSVVGAFPSNIQDAQTPPDQSTGLATDGEASSATAVSQASGIIHSEADHQLDQIPTQTIDQFWQKLQNDYSGYLPDTHGQGIIRSILDHGGLTPSGILHGVLRYFLSEVFDNAELLGAILILSVLAAVLASLQTAFERQTVSEIAYAMIFLVLMVLAIGSFTEAVGYAKHAIQSMTDFMLATVPLVVTLIAASGALASAAFFQPILLFAIHFISNIIYLWIFPLVFFAAVLDIVSALSPRYRLTRLAGLFRTTGIASLGIALSAFLGVVTVQGLGKGVVDGVTLRTAKFAVSTFIPVVGKAISDAAETVASASLLVKNAVGVAGLLVVICLALFPALKILALSLIYNGSAALMQPLGDTPMIDTLGALSKSLILIFASVAAVALMFFLAICVMLLSANLAVVMA